MCQVIDAGRVLGRAERGKATAFLSRRRGDIEAPVKASKKPKAAEGKSA